MKLTQRSSILLLCAVFGLLAPTAALAADVSGEWRTEFDTQVGQQKYLFTFETSDGKLKAKATAEFGGQKREVEFTDVKLAADTLTFVENFSFQGNEVRIDYTGKVAD